MAKKTIGVTKSEIYMMYPGVPKSELQRYMSNIIRENRNIPDNVRECKNTLFPKEFEQLKDIVGEPISE